MNERPNRVLIACDDPDRVLLLEEAFSEMDETRFARGLRGSWQRTYALDVDEAVAELRRAAFDVLLFDHAAAVNDPAVPAFFQLRRAAAGIPIVLLVAPGDELIGLALVRQGAQDFIVESELDCIPLERSLRCSIERHRLLAAQRNLALLDDVTGLLHHRAFDQILARDLSLAEIHNLQPYLLDFELAPPPADRDLAAIRLADTLFAETAAHELVARLGDHRFAVFGMLPSENDCRLRLQRLEAVLQPLGESQSLSGNELRRALCDNSGLESSLGCHLQHR